MSVSTELDIVNAALVLVGEAPITAGELATPTIEVSRKVAARWSILRDSLLRLHPWNCTRERAVLVVDATPPLFGYAYRYALPTGVAIDVEDEAEVVYPYCIRPLAIQYTSDGDYIPFDNDSYGGERKSRYQFAIEGRYLLTNTLGTTENTLTVEGINLLYSCRPSANSVSTYDSMLIDLFTLKLAAELSYSLTGSKALGVSFLEEFKEMVKVARSTNSQEIAPGIPIGHVLGAYN